MLKLMSSAALALVLTIPGWAQAAGEMDQSEKSKVETGSTATGGTSTDMGGSTATGETSTDMGGSAATEEPYAEQDADTAATDEELPDVSDSQPGVITGEDVQADEDQPGAGSGSTD